MSYAMHTPNQGYPNMTSEAYARGPYGMMSPSQGYYGPSELYSGQHYPLPPHPSPQGPPPPSPSQLGYLPPPSPMPQNSGAHQQQQQQSYPPSPHPQHHSMQHYHDPAMHYGYSRHQQQLTQQQAAQTQQMGGSQTPTAHQQAYQTQSSHQSARSASKPASAAYWASCDGQSVGGGGGSASAQSSPSQSSHCYAPPNHKSSPVGAGTTPTAGVGGWPAHPSPSMGLNSPSSTPSPASTPQHHSFGSTAASAQSQLAAIEHKLAYNGQVDSGGGGISGRSKGQQQNPLLSLQKMVQIEQQQQLQQHPLNGEVQYDVNGNVHPSGHPPPMTLDPSDPAYPTYYNLDQTNFPPTPYSPSIPSKASPEMVRASSQLGQASVGSCSGSVKHESGSENGDSSQHGHRGRRSYSHSKPKPEDFLRSTSSETCSNSPPMHSSGSAGASTPTMGASGSSGGQTQSSSAGVSVEQMQLMPSELQLPAELTRDSSGSYRGSEMTVNSRDSVKSSDSGEGCSAGGGGAIGGSGSVGSASSQSGGNCLGAYGQMTQSSSGTGNWKHDTGSRSGSGGQQDYSQNSQKSWWQENSPQSAGNSTFDPYYSGHQMASSEWCGTGQTNRQQQSTREKRKYRTKNSQISQNISQPASNSSSQPIPGQLGADGEIVVKKKRGRPFGSKNKRSLEAAAAAASTIAPSTPIGAALSPAPNNIIATGSLASVETKQSRKRKPILVDATSNTTLTFDTPESYLLDDTEAFFSARPGARCQHHEHNSPVVNESQQQQQLQETQQQCEKSQQIDELAVLQAMSSTKRKRTGGPVVRVEKSSKATKYSIVNLNQDENDSKSKLTNGQRIPLLSSTNHRKPNGYPHHRKSAPAHGHVNGSGSDRNWTCILCHKGPHHKGLGDLYGPYSVQVERSKLPANFDIEWLDGDDHHHAHNSHHSSSDKETSETSSTTSTSERRSLRRRPESASSHHENDNKTSSKTSSNDINEIKSYDVWVHEDCIVWSNSVYIDACTKIRNLEPAIVESFSYICTKCKLPGATLGCIYKNCSITPLHYLCAKEKDCDLDDENFILSCSKHKKQRTSIDRVRDSGSACATATASNEPVPELMSVDETTNGSNKTSSKAALTSSNTQQNSTVPPSVASTTATTVPSVDDVQQQQQHESPLAESAALSSSMNSPPNSPQPPRTPQPSGTSTTSSNASTVSAN